MKVGVQFLLQNLEGANQDGEAYRSEMALADQCEKFGFDAIWAVEHHFSGYSMCPNPLQFLAYMAGRTKTIALGSMVIVLPWHNPARVAGEIAMLDQLCDGRYILGLGRGLGRLEFEGLGVAMDESRPRFVEGAQIVLNALERGQIEFDGDLYKFPQRALRPQPVGSFRHRAYGVGVSPESSVIIADLGLGMLINPQKPWPIIASDLEIYRARYLEVHRKVAPPPIVACQVICDNDRERASQHADRYISHYFHSVLEHYEMKSTHFANTKGYEYYAKWSNGLAARGQDSTVEFYKGLQVWGTPADCIKRIHEIQQITGADHFIASFTFGSLPHGLAKESMALFAREVLPRLQESEPRVAALVGIS